jgi:hypothetical protein
MLAQFTSRTQIPLAVHFFTRETAVIASYRPACLPSHNIQDSGVCAFCCIISFSVCHFWKNERIERESSNEWVQKKHCTCTSCCAYTQCTRVHCQHNLLYDYYYYYYNFDFCYYYFYHHHHYSDVINCLVFVLCVCLLLSLMLVL